jgi:ribosomal protein S18 acetylase RimI-like enzyme
MNIVKINELNAYRIFDYWNNISKDVPYFYPVNITDFITSLFHDTQDGEIVFNYLETYLAEEDDSILGFIQFGQPHIYWDTRGQKCYDPNIGVIRNIYFDDQRLDSGNLLIKKAEEYFNSNNFDNCFAFNHVLGVSCNACHGKLHNSKIYIENLLEEYGYSIEHENVYYSISLLNLSETKIDEDIKIVKAGRNDYDKELVYLLYKGIKIGESKLLYLDKIKLVYMKTIWVDSEYSNKGLGTKFIKLICENLANEGYIRMDLDTAKNNVIAQRFYDKNGFVNKGITRSYVR